MFRELRKLWGDTSDAVRIISMLDEYTDSFLAISSGRIPQEYDRNVASAVLRLVQMKRPASVYPFAMRLLRSYSSGDVCADEVVRIFDVIESFLVRRALCGLEPTGLLGLFRFLWNNVGGKPTAANVTEVIKKRLTLEWPDDERFSRQILNRPLYGTAVANYVLIEYDKSLGGDFPVGLNLWVEHVLPQKLSKDWTDDFTPENHKRLVDTWANLIPLSSQMNLELSQKGYSIKREEIKSRSAYASARQFADSFESWTPADLEARANRLIQWAITRWPQIQR